MHGKRKGLIVVAALVLVLTLALASAATAAPVQQNGAESFFCGPNAPDPEEFPHPVAAGIVETYVELGLEVDYETVMGWFCEGVEGSEAGFGFGQIMLALQTELADLELEAGEDPPTAEDLLKMRADGDGWGVIWQEFGLIGRPDDAGPPEDKGKPEDAGRPEDAGPPFEDPPGKDGEPGPPEHAGSPHESVPPGHANGPSNDNAKGPPDHAGEPGPPDDDPAPSGNANGNGNNSGNANTNGNGNGQQKGRGGP